MRYFDICSFVHCALRNALWLPILLAGVAQAQTAEGIPPSSLLKQPAAPSKLYKVDSSSQYDQEHTPAPAQTAPAAPAPISRARPNSGNDGEAGSGTKKNGKASVPSQRCRALLERASLGDSLTTTEQSELRTCN